MNNKVLILLIIVTIFACDSDDLTKKEVDLLNVHYDTTFVQGKEVRVDIVYRDNRYPVFIRDSINNIYWEGSWVLINDTMRGDVISFNKYGDTSYSTQYKGIIDHGVQKIYRNNVVVEIDSIDNGGLTFVRNLKEDGGIDSSRTSMLFIPQRSRKDTILIESDLCQFTIKNGNPLFSNLRVVIKSKGDTLYDEFNKDFYSVKLDFNNLPKGVFDSEIILSQYKEFKTNSKDSINDVKSVKYSSYYKYTFDNHCRFDTVK